MKKAAAFFLAILMTCSSIPVSPAAAGASFPLNDENSVILDAPLPDETGGEGAPLPDETDGEDAPLPDETGSEDATLPDETGSEDAPLPDETGGEDATLPDETGSEDAPLPDETGSEDTPLPDEDAPQDDTVFYDEETGTYIKLEQPPKLPDVPPVPESVLEIPEEPESDDPALLEYREYNSYINTNITTAGSTVYYAWTPTVTGTYIFESVNDSGDTYGYLYDSDWNILTVNDDGGNNLNFRITYYLTGGTTYYFGAKWYSSSATGEIKLHWQSQRPTAPALSADAAATVPGATASAYISDGGSLAYYSITPNQTGEYIFESTNTSGDTYGYLYDSNWTLLESNDDGGDGSNFRITRTLLSGVTYYLGARWYYSNTTGTINVRLRMQNNAETISPAEADRTAGASRSPSVSAGQIRYYSFTPAQSGSYIFESINNAEDTYGYLYSSNWQLLASDDDSGENRNFKLTVSLTAGATYYFGAKWYYSNTSGTLNVRLKREAAPPAAFTPSLVAGGSGQTLTASIAAAGEIAYFSFTPSASANYVFEALSDGDTYGYLYDSNWNQLTYNDDGGNSLNFKISYALTAGTTYYFGAKWYSPTKTGNFNVRLSRNRETFAISAGSSYSVSVSAGGTVYFAFTPSASGNYIFESLNTTGDTYVTLYDRDWNELAHDDDGGENNNFRLTSALNAATPYYYGVRWYSASTQGTITVRLRQENPRSEAIVLNAVAAATQTGVTSGADVLYGQTKYFSITPTVSGTYIFESTNTAGNVTGGYEIYDANNRLTRQVSNSSPGASYRRCRLEVEMTVGNTYCFSVKWEADPAPASTLISIRLRRNTYTPLTLNVPATATITTGGDLVYFSFVPSSTGTYSFASNVEQVSGVASSEVDTCGYLYNADMQLLSSNDDGGNGYNFRIDYELAAGTTYYYGVKWYSSVKTGDIPVLLSAQRTNQYTELRSSDAGTKTGAVGSANISTGSDIAYFRFQPSVNGSYVFESTNSSGDTLGYLYDSSWQQLSSNDDGGTNLNFRLTDYLTAGNTYYYGVKWYSSSATGAITVRLRRQFAVSFNANGGTVSPSSKTVINGDPYGTLPTPSNGSRPFSGWFTSSSGGTQITSATEVNLSGNQTLYAHWGNTLTVTFNANGGSVSPGSKTVTLNEVYGVLPTPVRSSYSFSGWYTASSGGTQVTSSTRVTQTASHTLYARWSQSAIQPTGVSVTLQASAINVGAQTRATAVISPSNATNKTVTWSSGNTSVATVDSSGNVRGVGGGSTTIRATASNGVYGTATIQVNANTNQSGVAPGYWNDFAYKFFNTLSSFTTGSSYRIPVERYKQLGFSQAQAELLYRQNGEWGGSCFGFSTSSILFYKDVLQEQKYDPNARVPHDFNAPSGNSAYAVKLRSMMELFQSSQVMPGNSYYNQPAFNPSAVAAEIDRGNPVKFGIRATVGGGHAVVIYGYTKQGSTYHFDIYDNSNFITGMTYTSSSNYSFDYNNRYYTWIPNNYCTYSTIKAKYDQLKSNNYAGAANLLDSSGQTYTYLFCYAADMTITDARGRISTIRNDELSGNAADIQLVLSEVPPSGKTAKASYIIIMPTGEYTINGPDYMYLAGQELGVIVDDLAAGTPVSVSPDLKKVEINLPAKAGPDNDYSVTYLTYDNLFDQIELSGNSYGGVLTTSLYADHADVSGANLVKATASVSGKPAFIESFTDSGKTVSVQWLELADGITLWIGERSENGTIKDDKGNWLENGIGSNKSATLADRTQLPAPAPSLPGGTYDRGQTLTFAKDDLSDIYYTTDGSTPSQSNGELYPGFIDIKRSCKIRAVAVRSGYLSSEIVELDYVLPEVSAPAASLAANQQSNGTLLVDLFSASAGAAIYYTVDGTDPLAPTSSPEQYTSSIEIPSNSILGAYAVLNGCVSEVQWYFCDLIGTLSVEKTLFGQNGAIITSGSLNQVKTVRLNVSNAGQNLLNVLFTVAFYTKDGKMLYTTTQTAPVGRQTTVDIPIAGNINGTSQVKVFMTNRSYQLMGGSVN